MSYRVHPDADQEAEAAAEWYAAHAPNLGIEFARQYALTVGWIADSPQRYPIADDGPDGVECRNVTHLGRFPYRVVYALFGEDIFIVAVAHHHQSPGYWVERVPDSY